jgi:HD-GYP domain-containing protein (c-di-GMP phosphodiesterase class II)
MADLRPTLAVDDRGAPAVLVSRALARGFAVISLDDAAGHAVCLVAVSNHAAADAARRQFPYAILVSESADASYADLSVSDDSDSVALDRLLSHAVNLMALRQAHQSALSARHGQIRQLAEISRALAAERDSARLLERILTEGRRLANCEGGSLYLVDVENAAPCLTFKLVQNEVVSATFEERRLRMSATSLAGYVALTGDELNIPDAYRIPADRPYRFNADFDLSTGYRSRSLLVLPMRDHHGNVVGVLQFINRRVDDAVVPFEPDITELLRAVGSQAAIAIQKNRLLTDIRDLFEQFVQASVKAIERRDPTTSGHSFRVAETTTALFEALPRSGLARFKKLEITPEHMTEVRYAALLHDFGKVGVRDSVLVKSHKLPGDRLEVLRYRFELNKERLRSAALAAELELLHHGASDFARRKRRIRADLDQELNRLDRFFAGLVAANDPQVTAKQRAGILEEMRDLPFLELDGQPGHLVAAADLDALAVARGSLTPAEREEIERHVTYTRDFLAVLPWPPELARVPLIAAAHHEKLDGSGYPLGLKGDAIPLASRVMTVCDIYDALTAMDRPYKAALSRDRALSILDEEVRGGMLDRDIVDVFISSAAYRVA